MSNFDKAIVFTLKWEGGLSADKDDPGGLTKFGISQKSYPKLDIRNLTREEAMKIYQRDYWTPASCDDLPTRLAIVHFDTGVNCGTFRAAKFLQEVLGVKQDGVIGPKTIAAVGKVDDMITSKFYIDLRIMYYQSLVAGHPNLKKFLFGWLRRSEDLRKLIKEI